ncbi:MAG: hypothetical protein OK422_03735 [Thaumarchaeota archaeon]|nr:hypothetical protein [Nitrososphaerota archaeon]
MSSEIAEKLSKQTMELVTKFENRVDTFSNRDDLIGLTLGLDSVQAAVFAAEYFGRGEFVATGVDGSMDFDERLQMMLFYSNATGFSCPFNVTGDVSFDLGSARRNEKLSASAAIPLWAEDFSSVLPEATEVDIELEHSMERIPNAFMTLGELYLASRSLERSRIIFLDRLISGTYSTLSRDVRNIFRRGATSLTKAGSKQISMLDLYLGLTIGAPGMAIPRRRRFLAAAFVKGLLDEERSSQQVASALDVEPHELERIIKRLKQLDERFGGSLLEDASNSSVKLRPEVRGYWERLIAFVEEYCRSVFELGHHPLALPNEQWLTVIDVNALSFILLQRVADICKRKKILLVGIAKDTTATDVTRSVLPFSIKNGYLKTKTRPPSLKNDRAFLTILSSTNDNIRTPWRTPGYDGAFSTIIHLEGQTPEFISARKVVSREDLFVRSFFQLRTLRSDSHVRSPVFLFDRVYDDKYDRGALARLEVRERSGITEVEPYFEGNTKSMLSNLVLYVLSKTDNPEVFEAYGHNQLLYLADKAVKAEVRLSRSSLRAVADLRVGGMSRRKRIYGLMTSYREQRAEAEGARTRAVSRHGD